MSVKGENKVNDSFASRHRIGITQLFLLLLLYSDFTFCASFFASPSLGCFFHFPFLLGIRKTWPASRSKLPIIIAGMILRCNNDYVYYRHVPLMDHLTIPMNQVKFKKKHNLSFLTREIETQFLKVL